VRKGSQMPFPAGGAAPEAGSGGPNLARNR